MIDISGDGANNQGRIVTAARDEALAQGITINGLPLMLKRPDGLWDIEDLDLYFRDCVIGGPGAFMIPVREKAQFAEAIRTKVVREIADRPRIQSLVQPAQAEGRANCLAGELRRAAERKLTDPGAVRASRMIRRQLGMVMRDDLNLLRLALIASMTSSLASRLRSADPSGGRIMARAPCGIRWNVGPSDTVVSASGGPSQKSRAHG